MTWLLLLGGAGTVCLGTLWFVAGLSRVALALRALRMTSLSAVVAGGGSVAAVSISLEAALGGRGEIALGTLIGAISANLGLVVGMAILIGQTRTDSTLGKIGVPILVVAIYALLGILVDGKVSALEAALLLAGAVVSAAWTPRWGGRGVLLERAVAIEATGSAAELGSGRLGLGRGYAIATASIGLGAVILGGAALLTGAADLMDERHASGVGIGLTVAAAAAALPVLVIAARLASRGSTAAALEVALASATATSLIGLGTAGLTGRTSADPDALLPHLVAVVVLALLVLYSMPARGPLRRWKGALLVVGYLGYAIGLIRL
ncbi:MAG: hypothetical protein HZB56_10935 [Deltaproteobacteria bacterium]|nr:hypothetical protein [Deltaproteobacteria bacterium]